MQNVKTHKFSITKVSLTSLKAQILSNMFFGIPIVALTLSFLNYEINIIFATSIFYLLISIGFFSTLYGLLPFVMLRKLKRSIDGIHNGTYTDLNIIQNAISSLLNIPLYTGVFYAASGFIGFLGGLLILFTGVIPQLMELINLITIVAVGIGFSVSTVQGFLVYYYLERLFTDEIQQIVVKFPQLYKSRASYRKVSIGVKIFFLVFLPAVSSQISLLAIFLSKIYVSIPDEFLISTIYLTIVILFSYLFMFLITQLYSQNLQGHFDRLIRWSWTVISDDNVGEIDLVTNDEIFEMASYSSRMVEKLKNDKTVINRERQKMDAVLSHIEDAVIALNRDFVIVLVNSAATKIIERTTTDLVGAKIDDVFTLLDRDDNKLNIYAIPDKNEQQIGEHVDLVDKYVLKLSDKSKKVQIKMVRLTDDTEELAYILTIHDLSEFEQLEKMKLDFVSITAHELRTPITAIRGYLSIIESEALYKLSPEEQNFIKRTVVSSDELSSLIDNILNVSRIERGALKLKKEPVILEDLINAEILRQKNLADQKQIELFFVKPEKIIAPVRADKFWLSQVIMNLVSNAIKYTQTAGKVTIKLSDEDKFQWVHVVDNGEGIPAVALPHMFEKFFRVSGALEEGSKGTGLGLFISKSIIDAHGGIIKVVSKEGMGSTFSFSLPTD